MVPYFLMGTNSMGLLRSVRMGRGTHPWASLLLSGDALCAVASLRDPQPVVESEKKTGAYFFGLPSSSSSCALLRAFPPFGAPPPRFFAPSAGLSLESLDAPFSPPRVPLPRHTPAPAPRPRPPLVPPRATVDMVAPKPCSIDSCVSRVQRLLNGRMRCLKVLECQPMSGICAGQVVVECDKQAR